jgi:hypothetical protein
MTQAWPDADAQQHWDLLVELLTAIAEYERDLEPAPASVWRAADRQSSRLGLNLRGQLAQLRGVIDSPSGQHSAYLGERCQYCYSNHLDVDLYTQDPRVCPPAWACSADHPEPDTYLLCRLAPEHDGPHEARRAGADTSPEAFRWEGTSERSLKYAQYNAAFELAVQSDTLDDALTDRVLAFLSAEADAAPTREQAAEQIRAWREPRSTRSLARAGVVLIRSANQAGWTPALVDGPPVQAVLDVLAELDAASPGTDGVFEAAASRLDLLPYEVHLAFAYAAAGTAPHLLTIPPAVRDPWGFGVLDGPLFG